jgi:hypothetical protein
MRDIRADLDERLRGIKDRRRELRELLSGLDQQEAMIRTLMAEEDARWNRVQPTLFNGNGHNTPSPPNARDPKTPLAKFLVAELRDKRPHPLPDLVEQAKKVNFDFGTKNPGRSIHFALIGLAQNKWCRRLDNGFWQWMEPQRE